MSLVEIKWHPAKKELTNFGIAALVASAVIVLFLYFVKSLGILYISFILASGLIIFLSSIISFRLTRLIYLGLTLITLPIGLAFSFIILAAFYFLVITPVGLIFKIFGRDSLCRKFDKKTQSYWIKNCTDDNPHRYFRQF